MDGKLFNIFVYLFCVYVFGKDMAARKDGGRMEVEISSRKNISTSAHKPNFDWREWENLKIGWKGRSRQILIEKNIAAARASDKKWCKRCIRILPGSRIASFGSLPFRPFRIYNMQYTLIKHLRCFFACVFNKRCHIVICKMCARHKIVNT